MGGGGTHPKNKELELISTSQSCLFYLSLSKSPQIAPRLNTRILVRIKECTSSCVKLRGRKFASLSKAIRVGMKRRGVGTKTKARQLISLCRIFDGVKLITVRGRKQSTLCQSVSNYARCWQFWLSNKSVPAYMTSRLTAD